MIPLRTRVHEWLADRLTFVQYPNVRHNVLAGRAAPRRVKPKMDLTDKVIVGVFSMVIGLVGLTLAAFGAFVIYVAIASY
jgi:hypothetical protein